jgi:hypothetical protein
MDGNRVGSFSHFNLSLMKSKILLSAFLVLCIASLAQDKTVSKSFNGIKNIRLKTGSSDIDLKKSTGSEVKVTFRYSHDDDYKPAFEPDGSRLNLEDDFSGGSHSGNSKWILEIPDNLSLTITSGSGDITLESLSINIKSNTGSGDILITSADGDIDFNTGSGNVEVTGTNGKIRINTGSGDIKAAKGSGSYSFNAGSGTIKLDEVKGDFVVNTGSGNIAAKAVIMTGSSSFNTGSGDATVSLSGPLDNNVSVNSGSGDSKLDFNGNAINGEVIMTANKKGGEIVAPFSFDKEETVQEGDSSPRIRKTAKLGTKSIKIKVGTGTGTAEIAK